MPTEPWVRLYLLNRLKYSVRTDLVSICAVIFGSYVRECHRKDLHMNRLDDTTRQNIIDKFYDPEVEPDALVWRNINNVLRSDIDCVMTQEMYEKYKAMDKYYKILNERTKRYPWTDDESVVSQLRIIVSSITSRLYIDVIIVTDIQIFLERVLGRSYDFDINGLVLTRNMYNNNEIIYHVGTSSMDTINHNLLNNTAIYRNIERHASSRICSLFANGYKKLFIEYLKAGSIPIYLVNVNRESDNDDEESTCVICNQRISYVAVSITSIDDSAHFHPRCYADEILEANRDRYGIQVISDTEIYITINAVGPHNDDMYTFAGNYAADNLVKVYKLFKSLH